MKFVLALCALFFAVPAGAVTLVVAYDESVSGDLAGDGSNFSFEMTDVNTWYVIKGTLTEGDTDAFFTTFTGEGLVSSFALHRASSTGAMSTESGSFYENVQRRYTISCCRNGPPLEPITYSITLAPQGQPSPIPLPASLSMLTAAILAFFAIRQAKRRSVHVST